MTKRKTMKETNQSSVEWTPISVARKSILAGLGVAGLAISTAQSSFEKLAKDGERVQSKASKNLASVIDRFSNGVDEVATSIMDRIDTRLSTILAATPIATSNDIERLRKKVDAALG